jgi:MYXO-CTERM domain-containing protein
MRFEMKTLHATTLLFPLLATALGCEPGPPAMPDSIERGDYSVLGEQLDWIVDEAGRAGGGTVVSVWADGEQQYLGAAGDLPSGEPVDEHARFRAASISKVFTAIAVMRLVEDGLIDLDAPLGEQLPGFSLRGLDEDGPRPTPRHLLSHRSGVPRSHGGGLPQSDETLADLVEVLQDEHQMFSPGERLQYGNIAYSLLGRLIEVASGESYEDHVTRTILEPCGLDDSSWRLDDNVTPTVGGEPVDMPSRIRDEPAAGLVTSVHDLGIFGRALLDGGVCAGGELLAADTLEQMWSPVAGSPIDLDLTWGLGFQVQYDAGWLAGERSVGHGGNFFPFTSRFELLPDLGVVVVAMTTEGHNERQGQLAASRALQLAIETETGERPPAVGDAPTPAAKPSLNEQDLDRLTGTYGGPFGVAHVERAGLELTFVLEGVEGRLVQTDGGGFALRPAAAWLSLPIPVNDGELKFFALDEGLVLGARGVGFPGWFLGDGFGSSGHRIEPEPARDGWTEQLGRWRTVAGSAQSMDAELHDEDGFLALRVTHHQQDGSQSVGGYALASESGGVARIEGLGGDSGMTLRVEGAGGAERLFLWGFEFERAEADEASGCASSAGDGPASLLLLGVLLALRRRRVPGQIRLTRGGG